MTDCCNPRGCDSFFGDRFAGRAAKRYRKRGLDKNARRIVTFLEQRGIRDATVLEIGGGIGEIQIELLTHGASHAVNLELSPHYDADARTLLSEHGLEDRVERRLCDIAVNPDDVQPADVVILHRVVCCYPDYTPLLTAVAAHARRLVVFSYPPRNVLAPSHRVRQPAPQAPPLRVQGLRAPIRGPAHDTRTARAPPDLQPPRPRLEHRRTRTRHRRLSLHPQTRSRPALI